jgi:hypothetical protein
MSVGAGDCARLGRVLLGQARGEEGEAARAAALFFFFKNMNSSSICLF